MPSTYDPGDIIRISGTFTDTGGAFVDPTTVTVFYDPPSSTTISATTIAHPSTGVYTADIPATTNFGLWRYRFTSTGTGEATGESWFSVRQRRVV